MFCLAEQNKLQWGIVVRSLDLFLSITSITTEHRNFLVNWNSIQITITIIVVESKNMAINSILANNVTFKIIF